MMHLLTAITPMDVVGAAFSQPLVSLMIALPVTGVALVITSRKRGADVDAERAEGSGRSLHARYGPERWMLVATALAVIVVFTGEGLLRGYALDLHDAIAWWRFATPIFAALVGIGILLFLVIGRGSTRSEVVVPSVIRRTWSSFGPRWGLVGAAIVLFAVAATTLSAGAASSRDSRGRFVWLEIPIANEPGIDPIRLGFYGWDYGVPVLACALALAAATASVLHANAARPYIRPETVVVEGLVRRYVARDTVRVASAALLLTLAGSWRMNAEAGSVSSLTIDGSGSYEAAWRYAELAVAAGWAAPVLEISAFTLLLLVTFGVSRASSSEGRAVRREAQASR